MRSHAIGWMWKARWRMSGSEWILETRQLGKNYRRHGDGKGERRVLREVSLYVRRGEVFGLVGESGCGKSTLGRAIVRLLDGYEGEVLVDGRNVREWKDISRQVQIVFQDPAGSLNPRKRIGWIMEEPLRIHRIGTREERVDKVNRMLERIGLDSSYRRRFPHELSGGQRQRVSIGCALMVDPALLVADEPVSALDVSVQAQILNLLQDLHAEGGRSMLFISHNLDVVHHLCDRVAVMLAGAIVEMGSVERLYATPQHPYTRMLLASVPRPGEGRRMLPEIDGGAEGEKAGLSGDIPEAEESMPSGCPFAARCPVAVTGCRTSMPAWSDVDPQDKEAHRVRCHLYGRLSPDAGHAASAQA